MVSWDPFLMKVLLEKKKIVDLMNSAWNPLEKLKCASQKKRKKKNGGMLDANAIQTFTKWRLSTSHNKGRGNGNLKYITSIYIYGLMVAIKA